MAALTEHAAVMPTNSSMSTVNPGYDQDLDSFVNLDQLTYTSTEPARPKATLASQPSLSSSDFNHSDVQNGSFTSNSQSPIAFQAPSHQYDDHKQQTGLPPGALAHAMTFNHVNGMGFGGNQGFAMNGDMFAAPQVKCEDGSLDFNAVPSRNPSEMDMEADNMGTVPGYFFPQNAGNKNQFVDPNALGGQEVNPVGPSTQVGRMYPGMHQQQAAMAKAAQQQKQNELLRQQQVQQQQQQHVGEQVPQSTNPTTRSLRHPDPVVEERISRLLQQMRQNAMASSSESPTPSLPQMAKIRKGEHDMDDDERLLASEEGKRLSSKERRQLRNKVSARAFRSRRKEYIGQLESEVAARTTEAHELRLQNRALFEENAHLTDLARMLLSSPHFSSFLDDLNVSGMPSNQSQPQQHQQPPQLPSQPQPQAPVSQPAVQTSAPKDATPNPNPSPQEFPMQQTADVGMVMVPNQAVDVSSMGLNNGGWNSGIDMNFANTPVFAVMDVPQGPAIDAEMLFGKSSSIVDTCIPETSKDSIPSLDWPPVVEEPTVESKGTEIEISDPDPLFDGTPVGNPVSPPDETPESFDGVQPEKGSPVFELVVEKIAKLASFRLLRRLLPRASGTNSLAHSVPTLSLLHSYPVHNSLLQRQNQKRYLQSERPSSLSQSPENSVHAPSFKKSKFFRNSYLLPASRANNFFDYLIYNPKRTNNLLADHRPFNAKVTGLAYNPMKCYYQVITTPTADTPGTIIAIHFDDKRYLFGQVAEGTQRASTERAFRWSNLSDIFITGKTEWANNGGLIGTILTQAEVRSSPASSPPEGTKSAGKDGEKQGQKVFLGIHGGRNLTHTMATARRFVFRKGLPIEMMEYDSDTLGKLRSSKGEDKFDMPAWADENIKVWPMPISPSSKESTPQSPRKRSLDEFRESESPVDPKVQDQLKRRAVVSSMFHSSWKADALVERRLADVQMPAKIFIRNPTTKDIELYKGPVPGGKAPIPDVKVLVRRPWPGAEVESLPHTTRCDEALSYIVRAHDVRGKFDPKKAAELNVPKGPLFGKLANGNEITLEDGTTIRPDMVLGPPRLGKAVAIIDLPSSEYVDNLVNRPEWQSPAATTELSAFFWILGPGVGEHPALREFISRYPKCEHIVSSTDYCPNYLALGRVAESSIRLAQLAGDNYSIPIHDNVTLPQRGSESDVKDPKKSPFVPAEPGLLVDMEPTFGLSRAEIPERLNVAKTIHTIPRAVQQRMTTVNRRVRKAPFQERLAEIRKDLPGADAQVIALGTGSSNPSRYRNVSATLVHSPGYGYYLLDCGEATLGQLKRIFGHDELRHVLRNLRMIWISHLHADHHLGTVSLIKAWYKENYGTEMSPSTSIEPDMSNILKDKRLFVVSDEMMILWLEEYTAVESFGFDKIVPLSARPYEEDDGKLHTVFTYRHVREDGTYPGHGTPQGKPATTTLRFDDPSSPLTPLLRSATGLTDLKTARVHHCRGALGVSFTFDNGFKLSYSGDCRPSQRFAEIGHGSSILIHEATFQDELAGSACAKKHSTTAEALEVGRRMEARTILLTHFSQRYQKAALVDSRYGTNPAHEKNPDLDVMGVKPVVSAATEAATTHPDIPIEDEEEATDDVPRLQDPSASSDEIVVTNPAALYKLPTPVAAAFDYMRIRVGDIPIAQAFEPVLDKLFSILEIMSSKEAEKAKAEMQNARKGTGKKAMKKAAEAAAKKEAKNGKGSEVDLVESVEKKEPSAFSASESESGWETSEPETDESIEMEKRKGSGK